MKGTVRFRAIEGLTNTMVFGSLVRYADGYYIHKHGLTPAEFTLHKVKEETIGQFTGFQLGDTAIYEGDILSHLEEGEFRTVPVVWNRPYGQWSVDESEKKDGGILYPLYLALHDADYSEILGNIHQHPETLLR